MTNITTFYIYRNKCLHNLQEIYLLFFASTCIRPTLPSFHMLNSWNLNIKLLANIHFLNYSQHLAHSFKTRNTYCLCSKIRSYHNGCLSLPRSRLNYDSPCWNNFGTDFRHCYTPSMSRWYYNRLGCVKHLQYYNIPNRCSRFMRRWTRYITML